MKRKVLPFLLGLALLGGCQEHGQSANQDPEVPVQGAAGLTQEKTDAFPYPNLLAETADSFSLLVIGEQDEKRPIENDKFIAGNVTNILGLPTLEMAEKAYPELKIESEPAFLLFDNVGIVLQTKDKYELKRFLEKKR